MQPKRKREILFSNLVVGSSKTSLDGPILPCRSYRAAAAAPSVFGGGASRCAGLENRTAAHFISKQLVLVRKDIDRLTERQRKIIPTLCRS